MRTYTLRLFGFPILQLDVVYWDEKPPEYDDIPARSEMEETPELEVGQRIVFAPLD